MLKFSRDQYLCEWPFPIFRMEMYNAASKEIYGGTNNDKINVLNGSFKHVSYNSPSVSSSYFKFYF